MLKAYADLCRGPANYGFTEGDIGPSESGELWYCWFPRDPVYTPVDGLDELALRELRSTVDCLANQWQLPIVFKNLYCSMRLGPLSRAFPQARFIWTRRNPVYGAQSLLQMRRQCLGSDTRWASLKPREYESLRHLTPAEQVVAQIFYIERQINKDLRRFFAQDQWREVDYDSFCRSPRETLNSISGWLERDRISLGPRGEVPQSFDAKSVRTTSPEEFDRLRQWVTKYFGETGMATEREQTIFGADGPRSRDRE